jgi:acetyl esterase/lipase
LLFGFVFFFQNAYSQSDSIYLWLQSVPGESKPKAKPVAKTGEDGSLRNVEVTDPFLAVFKPKQRPNGKAILICPGGGYVRLAVHKEGYDVANWFTERGYTAFVLQYRVPDKREGALQDVQRSLRIIRASAKKFGFEPNNVAAMGFSAGAHLVVSAAMADVLPAYPSQDDADNLSNRPDRLIIMYPAYLQSGQDQTLAPNLKAESSTVPSFIFQTMDDPLAPNAFTLSIALKNAMANVTLHMLPEGGHGYGISPGNKAAEAWPNLLEHWLKEHF